jgi:hypothetical protein
MMTIAEMVPGTRVRAERPFAGIPVHSEGVIDEANEESCVVAWDLPDAPLPKGYRKYDGKPAIASGIVRDGFGTYGLRWLTVVRKG